MSEFDSSTEGLGGAADGAHRSSRRLLLSCTCAKVGRRVVQLAHLLIALAMVVSAMVEFSANAPYFDVLRENEADLSPPLVFKNNISGTNNGGMRRVMDLPVLVLFVVYFLVCLWLKFYGVWAWLITFCMTGVVTVFLIVNVWASYYFNWRFFHTRALGILLLVVSITFGWVAIVISVLNVRNWYPFKISKQPLTSLHGRIAVMVWNILVLSLVLGLCLLIWFSRLYTSWVCITSLSEAFLLCQMTSQVQCWQCSNAKTCHDLDTCTKSADPFHCLSPLYSVGLTDGALCVFNYNVGVFTFLTVFSFVGGIYFFLRTILNAVVKVIRVGGAVTLKVIGRKVFRIQAMEGSASDGETRQLSTARRERDSVLVSLPSLYQPNFNTQHSRSRSRKKS